MFIAGRQLSYGSSDVYNASARDGLIVPNLVPITVAQLAMMTIPPAAHSSSRKLGAGMQSTGRNAPQRTTPIQTQP